MTASRGIRNRNPLNIRRSNDKWQGLADRQDDKAFFTFASMPYGIRAAARILINYQDRYNIGTVRGHISRWAPAQGDSNGAAPGGEYTQDTTAYIRVVARAVGVHPDDPIDVHSYEHLRPMIGAMIDVECGPGHGVSAADIDRGLALAGIEAPAKPLSHSRTVKGAQVAAGGGLIATAAGSLGAFAPAIPVLREIADLVRDYPMQILIGVGVAALAGAMIAAYARWDDARRLAR